MSIPLYKLVLEYRQALDTLIESDADFATIGDTLDGLQGELHDKITSVVGYRQELDILAAGAVEAAKRMAQRAKALAAKVEWLDCYVINAMHGARLEALETDEFALRIATNPARVVIADGAVIPPQYLRTPKPLDPAPDKEALNVALQAGEVIEGVSLVTGERLAIK